MSIIRGGFRSESISVEDRQHDLMHEEPWGHPGDPVDQFPFCKMVMTFY